MSPGIIKCLPGTNSVLVEKRCLKALVQKNKNLNSDSLLITCAVTLKNLVKLSGLHFFHPSHGVAVLLRIQ